MLCSVCPASCLSTEVNLDAKPLCIMHAHLILGRQEVFRGNTDTSLLAEDSLTSLSPEIQTTGAWK